MQLRKPDADLAHGKAITDCNKRLTLQTTTLANQCEGKTSSTGENKVQMFEKVSENSKSMVLFFKS